MRSLFKRSLVVLLLLSGVFLSNMAFAAPDAGGGKTVEGKGIGLIAQKTSEEFAKFGKFLTALAYLSGFSFMVFGIFKFKQHKDNPTQIPLGTPVSMLVIGTVLVFIPYFIEPAG